MSIRTLLDFVWFRRIRRQGGLYVFRPEIPTAPDFTLAAGDFTTDGTWRSLSLVGILPRNCCCVRMFILVEDNAVSDLEFRRPGGIGVEAVVSSVLAGKSIGLEVTINLAGQRRIEYRATSTVWTTIELTVLGWFARIH